ncbi:MAG: response regulator transcription factor [Cyclobacteriaceae bacterium]|nr:response regulator transcription factor [Cyclobacteriaceae bacterium]MDH4295487.1 response regulator transcription factor [Cyclobacteriaceae bacterium]MDH5250549.1 response regulator transcription factor [Cyclobacteriaceae bacterium]
MKKKLTILVADDHLFMRESLRAMLEKAPFVKNIYEVENGQQAVALLSQQPVDVLLLDIRMPDVDGFEVIDYIHNNKLPTRIIALTAFDEEAMILNLMRAGVPGILFKKTTHQQEIYTAVASVMDGKHYYHEKVNIVLDSKPDGLEHPPRIKLSAREFEVIVLLCHGLSTKDIAEKLFLSEHTIEGYRKEIIKKTNTRNTNELIHYAITNGIVTS